ncbi:MAG: AAA family ATPase [Oscillospiraceae bacterium]|nr:AAA family ATPase [Oscillospiraceae bacterium]
MISSLKIRKLFGRFNYDIETKPGGVTIITGPNGYGKSTILLICEAISQGNFRFFLELEFEEIVCGFANKETLSIKKARDTEGIIIDDVRCSRQTFMRILHGGVHPYIRRRGPGAWQDIRTGQFFDEMPPQIDILDFPEVLEGMADDTKKELEDLRSKIELMKKWGGDTRLIPAQRLIKRNNAYSRHAREEESLQEVIIDLPKRLKSIIDKVSTEYSAKANQLDSTYPKRLLTSNDAINDTEYTTHFGEASQKFEKLKEYNLAEMPLLEQGAFNDKYATALKIYFDDFFSKYEVFERLIKQLDLFTTILNGRLSFKKIVISRGEGFLVSDTSDETRVLELEKLSSGEKQEIYLFFDLIFMATEGLLLLVDEPELSLHVVWQQKFLDDLLQVTNLNDLKVVVATHSPTIIGSHWDINIDLGELYHGN